MEWIFCGDYTMRAVRGQDARLAGWDVLQESENQAALAGKTLDFLSPREEGSPVAFCFNLPKDANLGGEKRRPN